jgi:hypothetical protein
MAVGSTRVFQHGGDQVIDLVAPPDPELDAARMADGLRARPGYLRGSGEVDNDEGFFADHPCVVARRDIVSVAWTELGLGTVVQAHLHPSRDHDCGVGELA